MSNKVAVRFPEELQEGTESMVGAWYLDVGDTVTENEPLLEVSTDKAAVEIPSPATGTLCEKTRLEGDNIEIGDVLGWIETTAAETDASPVTASLVDVLFPAELQEGTESMIGAWYLKIGDAVTENDPLLEISTDKVAIEVPAPATGVLVEILLNEGDAVEPDQLIARIKVGAGKADSSSSAFRRPEKTSSSSDTAVRDTLAPGSSIETGLSPAVKFLLRDHKLDAGTLRANVTGTGAEGRITREDTLAFISNRATPTASGLRSTKAPHTPIRKMVAHHMAQSLLHTAPHVTTIFQADMSAVLEHRRAHKAAFAERGVKLTLTAYLVMASVKALQAVPRVNSRWHEDHAELFESCNVGVGTALGDGGLVVPVVHDAQSLDLFGTATKLTELVTRARDLKLTPADMKNGTFTISNHGVSGSLVATPIIINQPQSAILGAGKLEKRVIVVTQDDRDEMVIRPMMYVTLTLDHRMLDAHQANGFMRVLVETLETWPDGG